MKIEYVTSANETGTRVRIYQFFDPDDPPNYGSATIVMWDPSGTIIADEHMPLRQAQAKFRLMEQVLQLHRVDPEETQP